MSKRHRRQAFSLVELLLVISVLGATLALATAMLGASFRLHARAVDRSELNRAVGHLAQRLRADAHAAVSIEPLQEGETSPGVSLKLADGRTLVYVAAVDEVQRRVEQEGEVQHRDRFRLPGYETALMIESGADDSRSLGKLVVVNFRSKKTQPTTSPVDLPPVQAMVGLHLARTDSGEADE